jgi:hypothetical protein
MDSISPSPTATAAVAAASADYATFPRKDDELRSIALAITTDKLRIQSGESPPRRTEDRLRQFTDVRRTDGLCPSDSQDHALDKNNLSVDPGASSKNKKQLLVDQAVESATHAIVTDAIETLLRDEGHTKHTYLKHEHELSVSHIPGVVPISKQLFSPDAASPLALPSPPPPPLTPAQSIGAPIPAHLPPHSSSGEPRPERCDHASPPTPTSLPDSKPAEITPPFEPNQARSSCSVPEKPLECDAGDASSEAPPMNDPASQQDDTASTQVHL